MSTDLELWFQTKTEDLGTDSKIKSTLIEIKAMVANSDSSSLLGTVRKNNIMNSLFDCLNASDAEQVEISSDVVFVLLRSLEGPELLSMYGNQLHRALNHPSPHVKMAVLKLLVDKLCTEMTLDNSVLMEGVVECLACADRSIAQGAVILFTKMGSTTQGLHILFSTSFLEKIRQVSLVDDVTRFRVYEIVVALAVHSVEGQLACCNSGLLPALLKELHSTDSLIQLNVLELMNSLSSVDHGLTYLQDSGVIPFLVNKILKIEEEPLSFILLPGLIEFFGNIFKMKPQQFHEMYPQTLKVLFNSIDTHDPVLLGVIITTVGKIGSSNAGKNVLLTEAELMKYFCNKLNRLLLNKNEITISVLNVLSVLLRTDDNDIRFMDAAQTWFTELGPNALDCIVNIARMPFIDLRLAALALINSIASQPWGLAQVCTFPGMTEYLLDRNTENDKDSRYAKFDIVQTIVQATNASTVLSPEVFIKLKVFVNEGPFYIEIEPELVFEGST